MAGYIPFRLTLLLVSGFWLAGCIPYTAHRDDPYFAGYHRADPSQGVTFAITDRKAPLQGEPSIESQTVPTPPEAAVAPEDRDYTYQDWSRNHYRNEDAFQLNLSYHLYGPYYYRDFRSRYWLQYQRRLPWYAGSWYDDLWWDYPYGGYGLDRWYDPWYGYYDPWYGYYDPYSYYGGYGWYSGYGWHPWYGTYASGSVGTRITERRTRNRRDLPTGLSPESDGGMTKASASQPGQSQSEGISTVSANQSNQRKDESSRAVSSQQARSSNRQGSYTSTSTRSRSSSTVRSTSSTSSSTSGTKSKTTTTARTRGRKP